ncbi:MAG: hypothetical protein IIA63_01300 [Nitrospinae bacterium]|nr:hypothetical protein [Nitrospinota bacterium]
MKSLFYLSGLLLVLIPTHLWAFDWRYEGRFRASSQVLFDPPPGFSHFDNEVELRNGLVGNLFEKDGHIFDYEVVGDLLYTGGIREELGLVEEYDARFFRAWIRYEKDDFKIRGGRQQILFGASTLFRPLGFFDTRVISGIIPLTRVVDGVRSTYFPSSTSLVQGWAVPGQRGNHAIVGLRGEGNFGPIEAGAVFQYHPATDLNFLADFNLEMIQMGYHLKGEKIIGYWNESRLDIQQDRPGDPLRFDTVLGADYTFDIGQGLHVLVEYFLRTQEKEFTNFDLKQDRTLQVMGLQLDQPVGIDVVWRLFFFFDLGDRSFQIAPQIEYNISDQVYLYAVGRIGGSISGDNSTGRLFRESPFFYTGTESSAGLALIAYF